MPTSTTAPTIHLRKIAVLLPVMAMIVWAMSWPYPETQLSTSSGLVVASRYVPGGKGGGANGGPTRTELTLKRPNGPDQTLSVKEADIPTLPALNGKVISAKVAPNGYVYGLSADGQLLVSSADTIARRKIWTLYIFLIWSALVVGMVRLVLAASARFARSTKHDTP